MTLSNIKDLIRSYDLRRDLLIGGSREKSIDFCVSHFLQKAAQAISERGRFSVALSGGSTPKAIYAELTACEEAASLDWSKVWLFWSDERCVAAADPESNYRMAMEAGFSTLPIPKGQIFRMRGEEEPEAAAQEYERQLIDALEGAPLDMVMLGMGDDGHTASLFPKTHALRADHRLVVANYIPQKECWRLTMTFKAINNAETTVIYVFGAGKRERVKQVFGSPYNPDLMPIQKVGSASHKALWVLDAAAAAALPSP